MSTSRYPCPCCGFLTLQEPPPGTFEICPVCYWEDDNIQFSDPSYEGGANKVSLETARRNYCAFGAISEEYRSMVRDPTPDEIPTPSSGTLKTRPGSSS